MSDYDIKQEKLYHLLKSGIGSGIYPAGSRLPNEVDMAENFGVARGTLRVTLKRLEAEDFLIRLRSKGTFVAEKKKQKKILIIYDNKTGMENPAHYIISGVEHMAGLNGIKTEHFFKDYLLSLNEDEARKCVRSADISGIVSMITVFHGDEKILKLLKSLEVPIVTTHTAQRKDWEITGFPTLTYEEKNAFRSGVEYLKSKGHQRIATIHMHDSTGGLLPSRGFSSDSYLEFLEEIGLDTDERLVRYIPYDKEANKQVTAEFAGMAQPPSAIMCYSDFFALYVYESLKDMKLRIPEDIAVMGFCGYPGDALLNPPLSTIDLQYFETGRIALKVLEESEQWHGKNAVAVPPLIPVPFILRERASTMLKRIESEIMHELTMGIKEPVKRGFIMKKLQFFTITELLVVIAIFSILMAMLLPALNNVRKMAKGGQCMSSLKQIGYACISYADDNKGYMQSNADCNYNYLFNRFQENQGTTFPEYLQIPRIYDRFGAKEKEAPPIAICPEGGRDGTTGVSTFKSTPNFSYSFRASSAGPYTPPMEPLHMIRNADTRLMQADIWGSIDGGTAGGWSLKDRANFAVRHLNKANISFIDGHVESRFANAIPLNWTNSYDIGDFYRTRSFYSTTVW